MSTTLPDLEIEKVRSLLKSMVDCRVAVIGDLMLDSYLKGKVRRVSPEAPVPIFEVQKEEHLLGGAANVAKCLVALGAKVRMCGVVGNDSNGSLFLSEAQGLGINTQSVVVDAGRPTTVKSRIVSQNQQMLRLDWETTTPIDSKLEKKLLARIKKDVAWADAIILSDYAKGVLTAAVCKRAIKEAGKRPVVVDPKEGPWERFKGATVLKPNRRDLLKITGRSVTNDADAKKAVRALLAKLNLKHVVITRSEAGLILGSSAKRGGGKQSRIHFLPSWEREIFDPTGAGDVIASLLALALAGGANICDATWLANVAAGIEVGKFGAGVVSDQEILDTVGAGSSDCERKVMSARGVAAFAKRMQKQKKKVVFTNGCFDILHYGHVSYLEKARRLGDVLIVALNSDASIKRLKGPGRPIQNLHDRLRIMAAQGCVDAVVSFDDDTPVPLLKTVRPDVLCKGNDYKGKKEVVGWEVVERYGGKIRLVELKPGLSTTNLLNKNKKK